MKRTKKAYVKSILNEIFGYIFNQNKFDIKVKVSINGGKDNYSRVNIWSIKQPTYKSNSRIIIESDTYKRKDLKIILQTKQFLDKNSQNHFTFTCQMISRKDKEIGHKIIGFYNLKIPLPLTELAGFYERIEHVLYTFCFKSRKNYDPNKIDYYRQYDGENYFKDEKDTFKSFAKAILNSYLYITEYIKEEDEEEQSSIELHPQILEILKKNETYRISLPDIENVYRDIW